MGNVIVPLCGRDRGNVPSRNRPSLHPGAGFEEGISDEFNDQSIENIIHKAQEFHRGRLRHELETNPHAFILDNLLMCVQFFDDFSEAVKESENFKRDKEKEFTELLNEDPHEGTILGYRRVKLLTGMSETLAQNYIYQDKNDLPELEEIDLLYPGIGPKDTFMTEGILPLEFTLFWDNLELYDVSEWQSIKDYSEATGSVKTARFCMEQPAKKDSDFPPGYIRLRSVDGPRYRKNETSQPFSEEYEYAQEIYRRCSEIPEDDSDDEEGSPPHSAAVSVSDVEEDMQMRKTIEMVKQAPGFSITSKTLQVPEPHPQPSTSAAAYKDRIGVAKSRLEPLQIPAINIEESDDLTPLPSPSRFIAESPTPSVLEMTPELQRFGMLFPNSKIGKILRGELNLPGRYSQDKDSSSGFQTMSTASPSSGEQQDKWHKHNVKKLCEFRKKSRKDVIGKSEHFDAVPEDCYSEVKYSGLPYDNPQGQSDESEEEDDEESDSSDDDDDVDEGFEAELRGRRGRGHVDGDEDGYELRFYLNSLQVSSNACSEFHYIGPKLKIPANSVTAADVLGSTIRCAIPHNYSSFKDNKEINGTYYVVHSFTPTLHSPKWPEHLYFHFNHEMYSYADKNLNSRDLMWPTQNQMERISLDGCNAVPLGFRSLKFFNVEQMLEWELNFQESEVNLLNSLKSPHWRCYIFAAIIFRAFLAHLGPQGIGHEHIRNVLYFLCQDNFLAWNDEQSGAHLELILSKFYEYLSVNNMPSFFIRSRNLLQGVPERNIHVVQRHVGQIRENLIIHCLYAFSNLMDVREHSASFALPDFKKLYEMLTCPEQDVLKVQNPKLNNLLSQPMEIIHNPRTRKASRSSNRRMSTALEQQDDTMSVADSVGGLVPTKRRDKTRITLHIRRNNWKKKQQKKQQEAEQQKKEPEKRLPERRERRNSIDLKKRPVIMEKFKPLRRLLIVKFFIEHFLKLGRKALDLRNYSVATMYLLQVENLCEIVQDKKYQEQSNPFQEDDLERYREETQQWRRDLGADIKHYFLARLDVKPPDSNDAMNSSSDLRMTSPPTGNNWDLRKLPTPPPTERFITPSRKTLNKPNIVNSLMSLGDEPTITAEIQAVAVIEVEPQPSTSAGVPAPVVTPPSERRTPVRQESIKFCE